MWNDVIGGGLLYLFLAFGVLSLFYKKHFPNNEPGNLLKGGMLDWLAKKLKK
jgi:hypothetical protein